MNRGTKAISIAIVATVAVLASLGTGSAQAAREVPAKAQIEIETWPEHGLFGYVHSGRKSCAKGRRVTLHERLGDGTLRPIGSVRAQGKNRRFQWLLKTELTNQGAIVAKAARTRGCARAKEIKKLPPRGGTIPACPSLEDVCRFNLLHVDGKAGCPSLWREEGQCGASTVTGDAPWCCWDYAHVEWWRNSPPNPNKKFFRVTMTPGGYDVKASLWGHIPRSDSDRYTIVEGRANAWHVAGDLKFSTPDLPDVPAGELGGPLYINWEQHALTPYDVYIGGYLYRTDRAPRPPPPPSGTR